MSKFKVGDRVKFPDTLENSWRYDYCDKGEVLVVSRLDSDVSVWLYSKKKDKIHHAYMDILTRVPDKNIIGGEIL